MATLFLFEIIDESRVVFRSDYFDDDIEASRRASEIAMLMGKCAPSRMLSYRILSMELVAGIMPHNFAL